jgi:hypothetical protein
MFGLDAGATARLAAERLAAGDDLIDVWRYCLLQLLDDYDQELRASGVRQASSRFTQEPDPSGSPEVDAALAALAEYLARRDGWTTPGWARKPGRYASRWWFVSPLRGMHAKALQESPASFRTRGIFVTAEALARV